MSGDSRECEPGSGCCGSGISRREFIGLAAGTAAGFSLFGWPHAAEASPDHKLTKEELDKWFAALDGPGVRLTYTPASNPMASVPLGGIGCGNVYIGVDGTLRDFLIFNNVLPVQLADVFLALRTLSKGQSQTRLLQTSPRPGCRTSGIKDIRMTGEYPFANLSCKDPDLPVELELEAYSPMIPLDSARSEYPAAVLTYKLTNRTSGKVDCSLLLAAPNAAGLGHHGGNYNTFSASPGLSVVHMAARPGQRAEMGAPLHVLTTARGFALTPSEMPSDSAVTMSKGIVITEDEIATATDKRKVFWLESPGNPSESQAKALLDAVRGGDTVIISGADRLLGAIASTRSGSPKERDIVIENFESGDYSKWTVEGQAFGDAPASGTLPGQNPVSGWERKSLVNSFTGGDGPKGKLIGKPFVVERAYIRFLIGGGSHGGRTCMNLIVGGKTVRTATGKDNEALEQASWDVREFYGKAAHLEIIDDDTGPWGHINVDEIVQTSSVEPLLSSEALAVLDQFLPLRVTEQPRASAPATLTRTSLPGLPFDISLARTTDPPGELAPGSDILCSVDGKPVLTRRQVGDGSAFLLLAPLAGNIPAEAFKDRSQALAVIAALSEGQYKPGFGTLSDQAAFGDLCIGTTAPGASAEVNWSDINVLLSNWSRSGSLSQTESGRTTSPTTDGKTLKGAVSAPVSLGPRETASVTMLITWRFPNYYFQGKLVGNHYAGRWKDSLEAARELAASLTSLASDTALYRKTLYDTTLPYWLVDCLTSQSSTIRSEVCVWTAEDAFAGYEGSGGCCPMNCSHVWGYEQTLAYLYPDLERRMRLADLKHQQNEDGGLNNRIALPLAEHPTGERPFADGHASGILKAYREHLLTGDLSFLREYYPNIKKAVDYLLKLDGPSPDGIIEQEQWNTYDCQVTGPNSFIGAYYLAALRAGEEMAKLMDDGSSASRWRAVYESGRQKLVDICFNQEYFEQKFAGYKDIATQYGPGCLSDQLIGQWWAHQLGLGYVLPREVIARTLSSIFRYNWMSDLSDWKHSQRVFADGHDKGLLCCTWPKGGRPPQPILYCDEVWTGVEYQVAAHMIYEGMTREALAIVAGARERYDGQKRNPWNEIECGGHYARAMANWSILLAMSGFHIDGPAGVMSFDPVFKPEKFKSFFSASEGWGSFAQSREGKTQTNRLWIASGQVRLNSLRLGIPKGSSLTSGKATIGSSTFPVTADGDFAVINLGGRVLSANQTLELTLSFA